MGVQTKLHLNGTIQKHGARLIAKGYVQKSRIDYNETFALVARLIQFKLLLHLQHKRDGSYFNWMLSQHS